MTDRNATVDLMARMTEVAASASEHFVPKPVRDVMDRTLVEVACVTRGGLGTVARELMVDIPAVDAWKSFGVPPEFRGRLTAMALRPTRQVFRTAA